MRSIVSTKDTNSGSPRIVGTRLTCANVVQALWYGYRHSIDEYLATYDYLSRSDVLNCLTYCAKQKCVVDNVHSYCEQCTLDKRPEDPELARKYDEVKADENDSADSEDVWRLSAQLLTEYNVNSERPAGENVG
ncbi:MAG: DUF433 domain-containing protein [Planctomycetaceae bacterium]|nr:DUF433 domain-containing protein [Planctomycetaceae bacterium]